MYTGNMLWGVMPVLATAVGGALAAVQEGDHWCTGSCSGNMYVHLLWGAPPVAHLYRACTKQYMHQAVPVQNLVQLQSGVGSLSGI